MNDPIVIVHWGTHEYARVAVHAAIRVRPTVFISTVPASCGEMWLDVNSYEWRLEQLNKEYHPKNFNETVLNFERKCLARWFVIEHWMKTSGTKSAIFVDSDCLMCHDPLEIWTEDFLAIRSGASELTWSPGASRMTLEKVSELVRRIESDVTLSGGEQPDNDMAAFTFMLGGQLPVDWTIPRNGWAMDCHIADHTGYKYDVKTKNKTITWKHRIPHYTKNDGTDVAMCCIHLWSDRKALMHDFYNRRWEKTRS